MSDPDPFPCVRHTILLYTRYGAREVYTTHLFKRKSVNPHKCMESTLVSQSHTWHERLYSTAQG